MDRSTHPEAGPWAPRPWVRLAWLPVPILLITMVAIWVAEPHAAWRSPFLVWLMAYGPTALTVGLIVIPAGHQFLSNGQPSVLMLGCGMWVMALGVIGGASVASRGLGLNWAIYDSAFLLSALCQFAGVAVPTRQRISLGNAPAWLAATHAGGLACVGLLIWGAMTGRMPAFYVVGQGGTALRDLTVGATAALFALGAALLWWNHRRASSAFLFWYSLGLALLAAGLAGSMLIAAGDSPLQWATRITRALGTVYLCVAVLGVIRENKSRMIPVEALADAWRQPAFLAGLHLHSAFGWALRYGGALVLVAAAVWTQLALTNRFGSGLPPYIMVYPAVAVSAVAGGLGPGILATAFSALLVDYHLLPPVGQLAIASTMDRLAFVIFICMGLCLSLGAEAFRRYRGKAAGFERQAEEAVRKDEFLALLGHELRNPLVPIGNAVYLIRMAGKDRAMVENACAIVEHQLAHIVRLVDDLLDVSRIAHGKIQLKKEVFDLVEVVRGVAGDYQPVLAENQLTLKTVLPPGPVRVDADRSRLVQVVSNLLHNACKFTDPGGEIRLAVEAREPGWGQVAVRDTGLGIPAEALSSIFEPFVQPKESIGRTRGGLGLGLALAKGLVELHGGTISAFSAGPRQGSEFILRLPVVKVVEQPRSRPPAPAAAGAPARRILVVEDLPDTATTLRLLLEMSGHEVETAHDGHTGLAHAHRFAPEIILCDIGLPGDLDGYDVARAIRRTPGMENVHLIAMTGFGSAGAKDKSRQAGFDLHLTKPVGPELLEQIIGALPARRNAPFIPAPAEPSRTPPPSAPAGR